MKTKIITTNTTKKEQQNKNIQTVEYSQLVKEAGAILRAGGVVAFPTETVYGLGANALDEEAAKKIYAAKGRPSDNPLIIHIGEIEDVGHIASNLSTKTEMVMKTFWPGALTLVLEKKDCVPQGTTGGLDTVAVRMPSHKMARDIIGAGGGYIAAPSANVSGRPSPTKGEHVIEDMEDRIDMIVVNDTVEIGVESTILDMTVDPPQILRPGAITREMLMDVIGYVELDKGLALDSKEAPKAPGMKYRHYAPKATLSILEGDNPNRVKYIQGEIQSRNQGLQGIGIITREQNKEMYESLKKENNGKIHIISLGDDSKAEEIASNLYKVLRDFDKIEVSHIYSESFWDMEMSEAIMNRLNKAAGYNIVRV